MRNAVVELNNLSICYSDDKQTNVICKNLSFQAFPKDIIAIMGPSGSGKTVLLKTLSGIYSPSSGEMKIFGEDCSAGVPNQMKRRMGLIYQDHNLLPWRTVEANLRFPFEIFKIKDKPYIDKRIDNVLEIVGLGAYRDVYPHELSGGMMQRVGIARAIAYEPELLLMDQPFGALDAITKKKIQFDFLQILRSSEQTTLLVTSSIDEALLLANKIIILSRAPSEILEIIDVDVPYSARTKEVAYDPQYTSLRRRLINIISSQYKTS